MAAGKPTDGFVSRYLNRKISSIFTRMLLRISPDMSPNKVTIFTTFFGIISAIFFLFNPLLAGFLIELASILDGVDGEIARLTGKKTKFGSFLDSVLDRTVDITTILFFGIFVMRNCGLSYEIFLIIFSLALSGSMLVSFTNARAEASLDIHPKYLGVKPIASRDIRLFLIFLGSTIGILFYTSFLLYTLIILAIITYLHVSIVLIKTYSAYKRGNFRQ